MKIHFDDIEFDPASQFYTVTASYQGVPFTGTAFFVDENFNTYYEWPYKNGNADGRWFAVDQATQRLVSEQFYVNGNQHGTSTEWFPDGSVESISIHENDHCVFRKRWNDKGILISHFDERNDANTEFYDNGQLFFETTFNTQNGFVRTFYSEEGVWLLKQVGADRKIMGGHKNVFNEEALLSNYKELDSCFHLDIIVQFIRFLRRERQNLVIDYLVDLLNQPDSSIKAEAIIRLGELKAKAAVDRLKECLHDHTTPQRRNRYRVYSSTTNIYSIAELAQRSLNQIHEG